MKDKLIIFFIWDPYSFTLSYIDDPEKTKNKRLKKIQVKINNNNKGQTTLKQK